MTLLSHHDITFYLRSLEPILEQPDPVRLSQHKVALICRQGNTIDVVEPLQQGSGLCSGSSGSSSNNGTW